MSLLKQINDDMNNVQNNVLGDLFKIRLKIEEAVKEASQNIDIKNHPFVLELEKKNKLLRKKVHKLERQLLDVLMKGKSEVGVIHDTPVIIKQEKTPSLQASPTKVLNELIEKQNITITAPEVIIQEEVVVPVEEEEEVEVEEEAVPVEEEVEEEEVEEVEVEVEEEEEVEVEEEEVEVEEEEEVEVEVEVEEEEEVEVEVEVEEEVEVAVPVEEEEEEEEESVYEVTIKGKVYYVMNEVDSIIYDADENGDISLEVGIYKAGKPTFYKK